MDSVFQSYIEYLPKAPVLKQYGKIESIFEMEEHPNQALRPIYYGAFRAEIENLWRERKLEITEVLEEVAQMNLAKNSLFSNQERGSSFWGKFSGNYCSIHQDIAERRVNYFQFGIDISKRETKSFVEKILEIAQQQNFILLGSDLKTFEPTVEKIDAYFRSSPAYKYIKTEEEFLKNVELGKEKTEVPFMKLKK